MIKACARSPQDTVKRDALSCVLPRMERADVEPDLFTYTALVKAFGLYRQGPAVQELMGRMHRTDFQVRAACGVWRLSQGGHPPSKATCKLGGMPAITRLAHASYPARGERKRCRATLGAFGVWNLKGGGAKEVRLEWDGAQAVGLEEGGAQDQVVPRPWTPSLAACH